MCLLGNLSSFFWWRRGLGGPHLAAFQGFPHSVLWGYTQWCSGDHAVLEIKFKPPPYMQNICFSSLSHLSVPKSIFRLWFWGHPAVFRGSSWLRRDPGSAQGPYVVLGTLTGVSCLQKQSLDFCITLPVTSNYLYYFLILLGGFRPNLLTLRGYS